MFCGNCGNSNGEGAAFCKKCGTNLGEARSEPKVAKTINAVAEMVATDNKVAKMLRRASIGYAIGTFIGSIFITVFICNEYRIYGGFESFLIFLIVFLAQLFPVIFIYAFGEVVQILHDIRSNTERQTAKQNICAQVISKAPSKPEPQYIPKQKWPD